MSTYRMCSVCAVIAVFMQTGCGGTKPSGFPTAQAVDKQAGKQPALKVSRDNPCSVMFPTEVGQILGRKAEMREVMDEVTCRFHFESAAETKKKGDETFIELKVHWTDGRTAVTATRLAGRLLGGGASGFEKIEGVGDEAWLAPMASYLSFSKGDVGVEIDMRMMPGEKDKTIRLAKLIAGRI